MKVSPSSAMPDRWRQLLGAAAALALGLLILGARWGYVNRFGTDLPWWDQWDAEGRFLLAPWFEQGSLFSGLFRAHNEHRVVLTKLVNFSLTLVNDCWDQRLQCIVNALLPAALGAALLLWSRRFCPSRAAPLVWLLLAAGWGLPMAWQNIVSGFQSQQFFLIGLSFGAIAWLSAADPGSRRWWLGAACAVLALGSMASGFFAAIVAGALVVFRLVRKESEWRTSWPTLAVVAAVTVIAVATRVSVEGHEPLQAHTWRDFGLTLWLGLQWPWPHWSPFALVLWAPWVCLGIVILRRQVDSAEANGFTLFGLGGWVLLQMLATAYARGGGGQSPAPRYMDTSIFGAIINALTLGWLAARPSVRTRLRTLTLGTLAAAWLVAFAWGAIHYSQAGWYAMHVYRDQFGREESHVRAFLLTNDRRHLQTSDVPYPSPEAFIGFMGHASLRALMPASVRPPLELAPAGARGFRLVKPADTTGALPPNVPTLPHEPFWSSWSAGQSTGTGEWTSGQLDSGSAQLFFQIAGSGPGVALEVRDAATLEPLARLEPRGVRQGGWESFAVRTPARPFVIVAIDQSDTGWLAFTAPVDVPRLSAFARRLAQAGWPMAGTAGIAGLVLCLAGLLPERKNASRR